MDKQATAKLSTAFSSGAVRGHRKRDRALQTAKLNASLASKIKSKLINNSSVLKVSLKQNNKALALALSVEKESSRKLKNERIFLQKEVEKLQLHNILLRRKLSCLNKTLREIGAFLSDNLLNAIEISSLSENLQSSFPLSDSPRSCIDDRVKSMCQSARSVELPVKLPLLATSAGKQQENQSCTELSSNSTFLAHVNNVQPVRQSEEFSRQDDSSLPFCGNVTERKKCATHYGSKIQLTVKDSGRKCSSNLPPHGSSSNEVNVKESPSDLLHVIPSQLDFSSECKEMLPFDGIKSEETIYDADMELTASDEGELLTVASKDKLHKNNNANSGKVLANFRKVKYSKSEKEKIKNKTEVNSNFYAEENRVRADSNISNMTDPQTQLFQSQTEQLSTQNSTVKQNLLNTSNCNQNQNCLSKDKDTRRTYLVSLVHQEQESNKENSSETLEDVENKIIKASSSLSSSEIPPQVCCAESLAFQDNSSTVPPLQQDFPHENKNSVRLLRNGKTFQNPSKMNTAEHCKVDNGKYEEYGSKKSQTDRCKCDSKRKQYQKNIIKSKCNKEGGYRQRETESDSVNNIIQKVDQKSGNFSPGRLKHTLAKAARKAYVVPTKDLTTFSLCRRKELENKNALCTQAVHGNKITETQQSQGALVAQNGMAMNIPQAKASTGNVDSNADKLKRADSSSAACEESNISNSCDNQVKEKGSLSSGIMESRQKKNYFRHIDQGQLTFLDDQEVSQEMDSFMNKLKPTVQKLEILESLPVDCSKNITVSTGSFFHKDFSEMKPTALDNLNASTNSILENSEISGKTGQDKALVSGNAKQKSDRISKEISEKTLTHGHGKTALQDVTNTSEFSHTSLPKSSQILEEDSAEPVRRGRAAICYKEPPLNRKLRRGDQFTDTQFLHSPVYKVKKKRSFKSKSKFI
ncbi:shugoshin 2 isoform X3 [Tympanuchus pallidicinctus]|nr:shugoshin 2 isoform X3 [Tympanuchus pallidicinctus]XP_052532348.1 shugoshin 2 isoform X3 [Tympanuchus pallidicinctus]XP_052532349.1 shugoshin 2 isoform X3 [Tympanuchus pallidicinctus]XP_052532350.1 shugoshin 2 isoform X3 [Tympanuchus pallidicinctus]